jgi:hypothetical protein
MKERAAAGSFNVLYQESSMIDAHQALQAMLQPAGLQGTLFPRRGAITASRRRSGTATVTRDLYQTALSPPPENFALLKERMVTEGERLDNISSQYVAIPNNFGGLRRQPRHAPDEMTETQAADCGLPCRKDCRGY